MANLGEAVVHFKGDTSDLDKKTSEAKSGFKDMAKAVMVGNIAFSVARNSLNVLTKTIGQSINSYADLEQSIGGVETLFKESADTVIANSKKAYQTAGIDANTYMQQVTSFSASLLQSLGGDTKKASEVADMAIVDMADNANKMGTSIESIQNAYQGFAKGQYQLLDNLKLGYGGTKTEMERLLADAEKITGIHYDISNLNDVYSAIHVIQKELNISGYSTDQLKEKLKTMSLTGKEIQAVAESMGITYNEAMQKMKSGTLSVKDAQVLLGTTAKEGTQTISGSVNAMKSAFQNFLNGSGGIEEVIDTVITAGGNIADAVVEMAPKIVDGIVKLINALIPKIPDVVIKLLPSLITGTFDLINGLITALPQILLKLAEALPTLIPIVVKSILTIIPTLLKNLPLFIKAGIQLILGLIEGLCGEESITALVEALPDIIQTLIEGLMEAIPQILLMTPQIMLALATGLIKAIPTLVASIPKIVSAIVDGLKNGDAKLRKVGGDIIKGLWKGMNDLKDWVVNKVKNIGKSILKGLKGILGIHSPSTEFAMIGRFSVLGYTEALDKMKSEVEDTVANTFGLNPQLTGSTALNYSPNVIVNNNVNMTTDPLGQVVGNIKTFSGGAKNDYNYGMGV